MNLEIRIFFIGVLTILGTIIFAFKGYYDVAYLVVGIGCFSMAILVILGHYFKSKGKIK